MSEDVRWYGRWMRDEAERRIGHLYPKPVGPDGAPASAIAWLWARTVTCPNPACRATMPLVRSFWLGKKKGKEAWVSPIADRVANRVRFEIGHGGGGPPVEGTVGRTGATCLVCLSPVALDHVRAEGRAGRLGTQLMAIVAEGDRRRLYLPPTGGQEEVALRVAEPADLSDTELPYNPWSLKTPNYGMTRHVDLFTRRQLAALSTFSDLVREARQRVLVDAHGDVEYADAIATYLAFAVSRCADYGSSLTSWASHPKQEAIRNTFSRQSLSMTWDFGEAAVFGSTAGSLSENFEWIGKVLDRLPALGRGTAIQHDAVSPALDLTGAVATDPPYYDNVDYSDLSDFFYIWLRRSLHDVYPSLLSTMLTPKAAELIANPYRFDGSRPKAEQHFEKGFRSVFANAARQSRSEAPLVLFYAFKQSESDEDDNRVAMASTGWEKMLQGLVDNELVVTGTWPMRTELGNRMLSSGTNALASSIVLVCRPRARTAGVTDRRGFIQQLKARLGHDLRVLQSGGIAPVDLAQAAIGPGMAVFSSYSKVVEPTGEGMAVRTALALINQVLDEVAAEQEGEFDEDTRWAIAWYSEYGHDDGPFGRADDLARAKNVSVDGLVRAGIVKSGAGKVRLLDRGELDLTWDPSSDQRVTVWEVCQHLIRRLDDGAGSAGELLARLGGLGDAARDLAYRLFQIAESKKWAKEAGPYNALAAEWPELTRIASMGPAGQGTLL